MFCHVLEQQMMMTYFLCSVRLTKAMGLPQEQTLALSQLLHNFTAMGSELAIR
jgi:hypothetical protein